jgi:hypothetical protein
VTPLRVSIVAAVVSFVLFLVVLELIRSRRLRERYALLWLFTAAVMLGLSLWRGGVDTIAGLVGIHYAPSALFVAAAIFIVVLLLHFSTVVSRLSDENTILAQRLALLEAELRGRREADELEPPHPHGDDARVGSPRLDEVARARHEPQAGQGPVVAAGRPELHGR